MKQDTKRPSSRSLPGAGTAAAAVLLLATMACWAGCGGGGGGGGSSDLIWDQGSWNDKNWAAETSDAHLVPERPHTSEAMPDSNPDILNHDSMEIR